MGLRAGTASQDSQSDGRYGLYAPGPTHGDGDTAATASDPSAPSRAAGGRPAALQPNGHGAGRNSAKPRLTQQLSNEPRSITPALGPTVQVARWGFGSTKCLRWRCWCRDRHCCWSRCYQRQCSKHPRLKRACGSRRASRGRRRATSAPVLQRRRCQCRCSCSRCCQCHCSKFHACR